jgi:hypothetical protein
MTWETKLVFIIGEWNFVSFFFFFLMFSLSFSYRSHIMVPINKYPLVYNGGIVQAKKCSHQVLNMLFRFPMCSPRVFPIAPRFHPICFAQSPPVLTYIDGPKGQAPHLPTEFSKVSTFFLWWTNQIGSLQKEKVRLVRHPKLINMKQKIFLEKDSNLDIAPIVCWTIFFRTLLTY